MLFSVFPSDSQQQNNLLFKQKVLYIRIDNSDSPSTVTLQQIRFQPVLVFIDIYIYCE